MTQQVGSRCHGACCCFEFLKHFVDERIEDIPMVILSTIHASVLKLWTSLVQAWRFFNNLVSKSRNRSCRLETNVGRLLGKGIKKCCSEYGYIHQQRRSRRQRLILQSKNNYALVNQPAFHPPCYDLLFVYYYSPCSITCSSQKSSKSILHPARIKYLSDRSIPKKSLMSVGQMHRQQGK